MWRKEQYEPLYISHLCFSQSWKGSAFHQAKGMCPSSPFVCGTELWTWSGIFGGTEKSPEVGVCMERAWECLWLRHPWAMVHIMDRPATPHSSVTAEKCPQAWQVKCHLPCSWALERKGKGGWKSSCLSSTCVWAGSCSCTPCSSTLSRCRVGKDRGGC